MRKYVSNEMLVKFNMINYEHNKRHWQNNKI